MGERPPVKKILCDEEVLALMRGYHYARGAGLLEKGTVSKVEDACRDYVDRCAEILSESFDYPEQAAGYALGRLHTLGNKTLRKLIRLDTRFAESLREILLT